MRDQNIDLSNNIILMKYILLAVVGGVKGNTPTLEHLITEIMHG